MEFRFRWYGCTSWLGVCSWYARLCDLRSTAHTGLLGKSTNRDLRDKDLANAFIVHLNKINHVALSML